MTDNDAGLLARRRFLKLVSSGALAAPVMGLAGCGGNDSSSTAPAPAAATPATETPPDTTASEPAQVETPAPQAPQASGGMPQLAESDPQAQALSYVVDASTVDAGKFPQYAAGKDCSNCALYTAAEGSEYGPCSIFPGKLVSAKGWCSVYAPKM